MPSVELPAVIDIEASGMGRGSYPIEVGFVLGDGQSYCSLIKPLPEWTHWDGSAQSLHGISRDNLFQSGREAYEVALVLNEQLQGMTIYSDAWSQDNSWLGLLYDCVGLWPSFTLQTIRYLITEEQVACWQQAQREIRAELNVVRHRASSDARLIQQTFGRSMQLAMSADSNSNYEYSKSGLLSS